MIAARNSLKTMWDLLTGPLCGWPPGRVAVFEDKTTLDGLNQRIAKLIHETTDVLLFYYVGHGQLLDGEHLGLALVDTYEEARMRYATSLLLNDLRTELKYRCSARVKLVILDCCFSGIGTRNVQGPGLADPVRMATKVKGAYTLTASRASQKAVHQEGPAGLTYFTKIFAEVVRDGIPGAGAELTLKDIHKEVAGRFLHLDLPDGVLRPEPSVLAVDTAEELAFARNVRAAQPAPEQDQSTSSHDDAGRTGHASSGPYETGAAAKGRQNWDHRIIGLAAMLSGIINRPPPTPTGGLASPDPRKADAPVRWQRIGVYWLVLSVCVLAMIGIPGSGPAWAPVRSDRAAIDIYEMQYPLTGLGPRTAGFVWPIVLVCLIGLCLACYGPVLVLRVVPKSAGSTVRFIIGIMGIGLGAGIAYTASGGGAILYGLIMPSEAALITSECTLIAIFAVAMGWEYELEEAANTQANMQERSHRRQILQEYQNRQRRQRR